METQHREACDNCHRRKMRCPSEGVGACINCRNSGQTCAFSPRSDMGRPKRGNEKRQTRIKKVVIGAIEAITEGKNNFEAQSSTAPSKQKESGVRIPVPSVETSTDTHISGDWPGAQEFQAMPCEAFMFDDMHMDITNTSNPAGWNDRLATNGYYPTSPTQHNLARETLYSSSNSREKSAPLWIPTVLSMPHPYLLDPSGSATSPKNASNIFKDLAQVLFKLRAQQQLQIVPPDFDEMIQQVSALCDAINLLVDASSQSHMECSATAISSSGITCDNNLFTGYDDTLSTRSDLTIPIIMLASCTSITALEIYQSFLNDYTLQRQRQRCQESTNGLLTPPLTEITPPGSSPSTSSTGATTQKFLQTLTQFIGMEFHLGKLVRIFDVLESTHADTAMAALASHGRERVGVVRDMLQSLIREP